MKIKRKKETKNKKVERKQQILKLGKTGSKILIADVSNEGKGRKRREK